MIKRSFTEEHCPTCGIRRIGRYPYCPKCGQKYEKIYPERDKGEWRTYDKCKSCRWAEPLPETHPWHRSYIGCVEPHRWQPLAKQRTSKACKKFERKKNGE